ANDYAAANPTPHRYRVEEQVTVQASRVDQVAVAAHKTMQLLQKGIVMTSNAGQGFTFKFTGLNSIKPDMITEATRNARAAADRFALDSGSRVGSIRQANEGVFSMLPADSGSDTSALGAIVGVIPTADRRRLETVRLVTPV